MRCTPNFSTRFFDVHHNSNNTVFSVADYGHTAFTYVNKSEKGYIFHSYQHKERCFLSCKYLGNPFCSINKSAVLVAAY